MAVPPSPDLPVVCASPEFVAFVERVKREFQVSITPNLKLPVPIHSTNGSSTSLDHPSASQASPQGQVQLQGEFSFKFRCQRSNSDFLLAAREMLEQFLLNHNVRVYPSPTAHTHKRGDSFAEAFPHFDSKVLSTARRHGEFSTYPFSPIRYSFICKFSLYGRATHSILTESVELTRSSEILGDRRLRLANSSPDVKALFNAPAYIYDLEDHEDSQSAYGPPGTGLDYWTPLPPIVGFYFVTIPGSRSHWINLLGLRNYIPNPQYRGCPEAGLRFPSRVQNQGTDLQTSISSKSRTVS